MLDYKRIKYNINYVINYFDDIGEDISEEYDVGKEEWNKIYEYCIKHENNGNCVYVLGSMCYYGLGNCNKDNDKFEKYMKKAINKGIKYAYVDLATYYYNTFLCEPDIKTEKKY